MGSEKDLRLQHGQSSGHRPCEERKWPSKQTVPKVVLPALPWKGRLPAWLGAQRTGIWVTLDAPILFPAEDPAEHLPMVRVGRENHVGANRKLGQSEERKRPFK